MGSGGVKESSGLVFGTASSTVLKERRKDEKIREKKSAVLRIGSVEALSCGTVLGSDAISSSLL